MVTESIFQWLPGEGGTGKCGREGLTNGHRESLRVMAMLTTFTVMMVSQVDTSFKTVYFKLYNFIII